MRFILNRSAVVKRSLLKNILIGKEIDAAVKLIFALGVFMFAVCVPIDCFASKPVQMRTWVGLLSGDGIYLVTVPNSTISQHELGRPIDWSVFEYSTRVALCPEDDILRGEKSTLLEPLMLTRFSIIPDHYSIRISGPTNESLGRAAHIPPLRIHERLVEGSVYALAVKPSFSAVTYPDKLTPLHVLCEQKYRNTHRVAYIESGRVEYLAFPNKNNPASLTLRYVGDSDDNKKYQLLRKYDKNAVVGEEFWRGAFTYFQDGSKSFDERDFKLIDAAIPGMAETIIRYRNVIAILVTIGVLLGGHFGNLTFLNRLGFRTSAIPTIESIPSFIGQQIEFFANWRTARSALMIAIMSIAAIAWKVTIAEVIEKRSTALSKGEHLTQFFFGTEALTGISLSFLFLMFFWILMYFFWFSRFGTKRDTTSYWLYPFLILLSAVIFYEVDTPSYLLIVGFGSTCLWMHWRGIEEAHRTIQDQGEHGVNIRMNDSEMCATIIRHTSKCVFALRSDDKSPIILDATKILSISTASLNRIIIER